VGVGSIVAYDLILMVRVLKRSIVRVSQLPGNFYVVDRPSALATNSTDQACSAQRGNRALMGTLAGLIAPTRALEAIEGCGLTLSSFRFDVSVVEIVALEQ